MHHYLSIILDGARPWAHIFYISATSWLAWRIYVLIAAAAVLATSFWIATLQRRDLLKFKPHRGPKPRLRATIQKQLDELSEFRRNATQEALTKASIVLLFGFVIPSTVLAFAIYFYPWFLPGNHALASSGCGHTVVLQPTLMGIFTFVISQLTMGVSNTAGDLMSGSFQSLIPSYTAADGVVAIGLGAYRYFVAIFAGAFVHLLVQAFNVTRANSLEEKKNELEEALARADH